MELRHLRYFVALAETLNFSRAAGRLRLTQPALSRQIRDLEEELGCSLVRRGRNVRTELTAEGRRLRDGAARLLAAADALATEIRAQAAVVRLGHYGALWLDYFTPALRRFAQRHPQVVLQPVDLMPNTLPGALRHGEIDVAMLGMVDAAVAREFATQAAAVVDGQLVLGATHPLAKRRKLTLAELRDEEWVSWDPVAFPGRKALLVEACRRAGFRPKIVQETDSVASLLVSVATSGAVGVSLPMAAQMPHQGVVFTACEPKGAVPFEMHLGWRRDDPRRGLFEELAREMKLQAPSSKLQRMEKIRKSGIRSGHKGRG